MVRPKHLKSPFPRGKTEVAIHDRIWFSPEKVGTFTFPGFEDPSLFGRKEPVCLEYCSGNGTWIASKAKELSHYNWFGIEMQWKRVKKIWSKIQNHTLPNLVGVCGEALSWTRRFIADSSIHKVFVNFPDPWPKKRHSKHRLINYRFIEELSRILEPGGEVMIVTDHSAYSDSIIDLFLSFQTFSSKVGAPYYLNELEGYGTSFFDELWRDRGLEIRYIPFVRQ